MNYIRYIKSIVLVVLISSIVTSTLCGQDTVPEEVAALVSVLTSDADTFDKAKACQRLVLIGDESAVPALAGLLASEELSAYAREALEAIPGPAPDAALRESLTRLEGERLIGVLGSIGVRRDVEAIDAVTELLVIEADSSIRSNAAHNARTIINGGTGIKYSDDQATASAAARSVISELQPQRMSCG